MSLDKELEKIIQQIDKRNKRDNVILLFVFIMLVLYFLALSV